MSPRRAWARRLLAAVSCAAGLWLATPGSAQQGTASVPPARAYVTDSVGVIGAERSAQLESYLDELQKKTGVQFAVVVVRTTAPEAPEQYKVRLFKEWGIGRKEEKDGLLLLVAMEERRAVFETGYGLEGTLPDGWEARMLRELLVPRFRAGEYADGITVAVLAASERIANEKGVTVAWTGDVLRYGSSSGRHRRAPPEWIIAMVFFLLISLLSRLFGGRRGYRRGPFIGGPWIGGGWGGGFGGGGGGSSFGGFGGGSSGGGGGGAGW